MLDGADLRCVPDSQFGAPHILDLPQAQIDLILPYHGRKFMYQLV